MPGQEGNIGVAVKKGRTDGEADLRGFYFASQFENKVIFGHCTRYQNATVKFFSKK
jgi:hypothetical protein